MPRAKPGEAWRYFQAHLHDEHDDCRHWPFHLNGGHGKVTVKGHGQIRVPRLACATVHGPAPSPLHIVGHTCGPNTEWCWNPRHLRWRTQAEHLAYRERWSPRLRGADHPQSILTMDECAEVIELRRNGAAQRVIADKLGVSQATVLKVLQREGV